MRSRGFLIGPVVAVLVAAIAGVALGSTARSTAGGTSVERVNVARGTDVFHSSGTAFADVGGATTKLTVPAGHRSFLVARFTAQADCNVGDGNPSGHCMARILLGSNGMQPGPGGTIVDSVIDGRSTGIRSIALDRSTAVLGPGTYTVKVQARVTSALMILEITDWHLTIERVDV